MEAIITQRAVKGVRCALARGVQSPQPDPDLDVGSLPVATRAHAHDSQRLVVPLRGSMDLSPR